jgi:hypothetical protein
LRGSANIGNYEAEAVRVSPDEVGTVADSVANVAKDSTGGVGLVTRADRLTSPTITLGEP